MSISQFVFIVIAAVALLAAITAVYYLKYKGNINKALTEKGKRRPRMMPPLTVVIALSIVLVTGIAALNSVYHPGEKRLVNAHDIEEDLREFDFKGEWEIKIAMSDHMAAALAYDDITSEHPSFRIYRNTDDARPNYVFRYGGHATSIVRGVKVVEYDGKLALLSMNALHIAKIACHDAQTYELDPDSPFVLIIPNGGYDVYDRDGNLIDLKQEWWYEKEIMN